MFKHPILPNSVDWKKGSTTPRVNAGAWGVTASPSLSSLSIQWLRQPGADAPLDGSGHRPMPPQLAALPLVVNSSFGVSSGAASGSSPFTIGERGCLGQPARGASPAPQGGLARDSKKGSSKMA